ncbi:hypothetical protein Nepgr_014590 [Nepenthes gracilis]|uniref:DCD domain-containing protein n=1 Tax=Nepenthes gracilis TaxID=150966 RepID=A0AAD3XQA0_NEPGR|nr:hypothetical protein Nepgr_014590 [Nepenthes gracilis]
MGLHEFLSPFFLGFGLSSYKSGREGKPEDREFVISLVLSKHCEQRPLSLAASLTHLLGPWSRNLQSQKTMVSAKGKGKGNASKSKAKSFGSADEVESVTGQFYPTETGTEKSVAVPELEEETESSNKVVEMGEEEEDEMIGCRPTTGTEYEEKECNADGSNHEEEESNAGDTKHEEKESNAGEVKSEDGEAANNTNTEGDMVVPGHDEKEDGTNEMEIGAAANNMKSKISKECVSKVPDEEKDSLTHETVEELTYGEATAVCETSAEEPMVVSESKFKQESMVVNLTNGTEREANNISGNLLMGDIATKNKLKKSKKAIKRKVAVQRGKVASQNEGKFEPSEESRPAAEPKDVKENEHEKKEDEVEAKPVDKVKSLRKVGRKKVVVQRPTVRVVNKDDKPEPSDKNTAGGKEGVIDEQHVKTIGEEARSENLSKRSRKRRRLRTAKLDSNKRSAEDKDKAETSQKSMPRKNPDSKGMIFMCSSKTKKDCYHYKVMGLPASKKDLVLTVCEGMRLFLFDFDLRLLYGIYKAAGPGGYNIEPRAFKSDFPSQVRFTVLEDCVPLAEEKFREVIKDNYYAKNKFNCELSSEQVKNLCGLFRAATKGKYKDKDSKPEKAGGSRRTGVISSYKTRGRKRGRARDEARRDRVVMNNGSKRQARDTVRRDRVVVDDGYHRRLPVYEREAFVPAAAAPAPLIQPLPQVPALGLSYAYGRSSGYDAFRRETAYEQRDPSQVASFDIYRRDPALHYGDQGLPSVEARRAWDDPVLREPYASYRESLLQPLGQQREPGYHLVDYPRATVDYHLPADRNAAYRNSETLYRRY